jgi:hydrogenase nickel incorporation protein HypB
MCENCGCSEPGKGFTIYKPGETTITGQHTHDHEHSHGEHTHTHDGHTHSHDGHEHTHSHDIVVEQDILSVNNLKAMHNRGWFDAKNIFSLNLVSSPGSGKTSLLERTLREINSSINCYVVEGDQQTDNDARRIEATGAPVVQINTGNACHLDADMVYQALTKLQPVDKSIVFIENVGNLVCPAMFDLGETTRVVIFSVTEGEDKPLKYPNMFNSSQVCVINKIDLLPYLDFDLEKAKENALKVNHHLTFIEVSVRSGEGMDKWISWLKKNMK